MNINLPEGHNPLVDLFFFESFKTYIWVINSLIHLFMHVKIIPSILISMFCTFLTGQESTEIYLFDLQEQDSTISLSNPVNISAREGYDNQPSFTDDSQAILFSSFRNGQSDISKYFINEHYRVWITDTEVNEFSPMPFPGKKKYFTCVRLNGDETQFLYKYAYKKRPPELLIPDLRIGYYLWFDEKILISFVIGDVESLQVSNFKYKIRYPIQKNIGRSIQKIPATAGLGSQLVSFISLDHEAPEIYAIDPMTSDSKYITDPIKGSQDLAWTKNGSILMGHGNKIYSFHPDRDSEWQPVTVESPLPFDGISRLVISPDGTKIAVVVNEAVGK